VEYLGVRFSKPGREDADLQILCIEPSGFIASWNRSAEQAVAVGDFVTALRIGDVSDPQPAETSGSGILMQKLLDESHPKCHLFTIRVATPFERTAAAQRLRREDRRRSDWDTVRHQQHPVIRQKRRERSQTMEAAGLLPPREDTLASPSGPLELTRVRAADPNNSKRHRAEMTSDSLSSSNPSTVPLPASQTFFESPSLDTSSSSLLSSQALQDNLTHNFAGIQLQ
jgi:hypothetical protein